MARLFDRYLLLAAVLLSGLLAGLDVDRMFVAMPAWRVVGAEGWAQFSQHADLGNGLLLYPLEAVGSVLFGLGAVVAFRFDHTAARAAALPLYAGLLLAIAGLLLTFKAAPVMLGIESKTDPEELRHAFEMFYFWGNIRECARS
jgi:hypothetical protein